MLVENAFFRSCLLLMRTLPVFCVLWKTLNAIENVLSFLRSFFQAFDKTKGYKKNAIIKKQGKGNYNYFGSFDDFYYTDGDASSSPDKSTNWSIDTITRGSYS